MQCTTPGTYVECHMTESNEWVVQRIPQSMDGSSTWEGQRATAPPDSAVAIESAAPRHAILQPAMVLTPKGSRE
eukprot:3128208-Ditylum_brightwellii.AAC.1